MKLIFLGTGYAIPKPGRNAPCTVLECGGQLYLLDAGAPVLELLAERGQTPEQIRAVFTTHSVARGEAPRRMSSLLLVAAMSRTAYSTTSSLT